MIDKQRNTNRAEIAKNIAEKYGLAEVSKELSNFIVSNNNYRAHILLIGGYSAGKSALLNKYIGKEVLIENQGPQTNVATELLFSENERIVANMLDGTRRMIKSTDDVDVALVRNVEYYLNSENIKTQCDYVIVDTPGFDSGVEAHNKALMQYIDRGTVFILVVDCEKGTISESALNFMNEISNFSTDIAVVINKCEKKTNSEVAEIKEHTEDILLAFCGRKFEVVCTSARSDEAAEKLKTLISTFQPQYLYEKNITKQMDLLAESLIASLITIRDKHTCDTSVLDEEIENREKAKVQLLEKAEKQKKRLSSKLHNEVKEMILNKIQSQLMISAPMLAEAYKGGEEAFLQKTIEIIRPIIVSEIDEYSTTAWDDFCSHLDYSALNTGDKSEEIVEAVNSIYEKLFSMKNSQLLTPKTGLSNEELSSVKVAYKETATMLAILTEEIWPILELVIVFLPEILKFLSALTGNTQEQQMTEAIQHQIIPQIVSKIRGELDKSLSNVEEAMIDSMCHNIEEIVEFERQALEAAKARKEEYISDYNSFITDISNDIERLERG